MGSIPSETFCTPSGDEVHLRVARPEDADALLALARAIQAEDAYMVTVPEEFGLTEDDKRAWIEDHARHPGQLVVVAEAGGRVVGAVDFEARRQRRLSHSGAFAIAVEREWRGRGVGRALLETLLAWAQAHPELERVELAVFGNNERALKLYRSLGFLEEGRRLDGIKLGPGKYVDDVLMARSV